LLWLEKTIAPRANYVITVGELLAERFESFGAKTEIVGNYPELDKFKSDSDPVSRSNLEIPLHDMVVAYIGGFTQAREILPLLESSNMVSGTSILLAGDGPQREDIVAALPKYPKVRYHGWISQEMVPAYTSAADVIYYGLKTADGNSQYSTPNALFNAMAAGKPVITTNIGEIARIVKNIECGLVIPAATAEQIASAIVMLKDDNLRLQMGINARNASASLYNWDRAQEKLVRVYGYL
jgi:glycosyltransferase involved in cell wall biosynthesis